MGPPGMLPSMHGPPGMPPMSRDGSMGMSFLSGAGQHPSMAGLGGAAGAAGQFHAAAGAALHAATGGATQSPYHHSLPTSVASVPDLSSGVLSIGNTCWLPNPHDDGNLWLLTQYKPSLSDHHTTFGSVHNQIKIQS